MRLPAEQAAHAVHVTASQLCLTAQSLMYKPVVVEPDSLRRPDDAVNTSIVTSTVTSVVTSMVISMVQCRSGRSTRLQGCTSCPAGALHLQAATQAARIRLKVLLQMR